MTDQDLAQRAMEGERRAFDLLVDRHATACLRYATRMLGSREDAEEAAQDAWLRAYRALPVYDLALPFRTWLFAILINRCRTVLSARRNRERHLASDAHLLDAAGATAEPHDVGLRIEIDRALQRLSPDLREAFLLKHVEQLEYTEMVEVTGAGMSALKMRVQRACQQLRVELQEYADDR